MTQHLMKMYFLRTFAKTSAAIKQLLLGSLVKFPLVFCYGTLLVFSLFRFVNFCRFCIFSCKICIAFGYSSLLVFSLFRFAISFGCGNGFLGNEMEDKRKTTHIFGFELVPEETPKQRINLREIGSPPREPEGTPKQRINLREIGSPPQPQPAQMKESIKSQFVRISR